MKLNKQLVGFGAGFVVAGLSAFLLGRALHPFKPLSKQEQERRFIQCFREEFSPTDAQLDLLKTKIFKEEEDSKKAVQNLEKGIKELETRLESEAQDPELLEKFNRVESFRHELSERHFRKMLALRAILNPEQRSKFGVCKRKLVPNGPPPPGGPEGPGGPGGPGGPPGGG